ncbi:MAG: NAD-dependent epimerase/dehydratase family protein, partial [Parachlamydiaceae bacterium]|nr:NAD-dependent epimerase/dehydratase family protein [Parachlamydiaceae bacterium]
MPQTELIAEDHPCFPINPYGRTKLMVESILSDYDAAYGLKSCCLRYFNASGNDPDSKIHSLFAQQKNRIPLIFQSLSAKTPLTIYGTDYPTKDGTCIRDYIHVADLAEAHLQGLERILSKNESCSYNLGNGHGYSVKEVIDAVKKITGLKIKVT